MGMCLTTSDKSKTLLDIRESEVYRVFPAHIYDTRILRLLPTFKMITVGKVVIH